MVSKIATVTVFIFSLIGAQNAFSKEKKGDDLSGVCVDNKVALKIKTSGGKQKTLFLLIKGSEPVACSVSKTKIRVSLLSDPIQGLNGEGFTVFAMADIDDGTENKKSSKFVLKVLSTFQEKVVPRNTFPGSTI